MKSHFLLFLTYLALSSCQDFNSNTGDDKIGGIDCSQISKSDELRFCNAQNVILRRCVSCHSGYHNKYADYTESDYKTKALILPGDSAGSTIFSILLNEGGTMPKDGKPLSSDEYTYIMEWIDQSLP